MEMYNDTMPRVKPSNQKNRLECGREVRLDKRHTFHRARDRGRSEAAQPDFE